MLHHPRTSGGGLLAAALFAVISFDIITRGEAAGSRVAVGGPLRGRRALSRHADDVQQVSFPDHPPRPPPYPPWLPTYNKTAINPALLGAHGNFQGLKCLPFSTYPAPQCPLDGAGCLPNSTCVWWESGAYKTTFLQSPAGTDDDDWRSARCAASTCSSPDVPGAFEDLVWKPSTCSSTWFTPQEAFQCLKGKRVLFSGDSMLRHVFNRLIQYLRGIPDVMEHYYHTNTRYTHNGTHDLFELSALPPRHSVPRSQWNRDSLELGLLWSPKSFKVEEIVAIDPDVLVTGLIYHPTDTCKWVLPLLKATTERIQIPGGLFWLTTPTIAPEPWKKQFRAARNAFYRETFAHRCNATATAAASRRATVAADNGATMGGAGIVRPGPWQIVPLDDMAAPELFLTNPQDLIHYQCRHNAHIDQPLILDDIRSPVNGDCRDLMNLNVVQLLLNQVCCPHPEPDCAARRA